MITRNHPGGRARQVDPVVQAVGNHDQFWMGGALVDNYVRKTLVGPHVLNINLSPDFATILNTRNFYMGVVDGSTPYGNIIYAGYQGNFKKPPKIAPDPQRRSLSINQWMNEFRNTTSQPVGHGFTPEMIKEGFAFRGPYYPRADIPDQGHRSGQIPTRAALHVRVALSTRNAYNGYKMNSRQVRRLMSS